MTQTPEAQDSDELLVAALARGLTHEDAAQQAGISRSTVTRRMAIGDFRERVNNARRELLTRSAAMLAESIATAIETLKKLMSESESETVQLGAAKAILQTLLPLNAQFNLEDRITALETR